MIKKIEEDLKINGFAIVPNFLSDNDEFKEFKKYLKNFMAQNIIGKSKKHRNTDRLITSKFLKDKRVSAYLNDNINLSPYLGKMLSSKQILSLLSKVLKVDKKYLIINNQRFRVQIPSNDKISNLPWHQDAHYNVIKNTKSIVVWISISDILEEMGPIIFKINSHKYGELKRIKIKKPNGGTVFTVNMNDNKIKNLKTASMETKSGDIILIDMNSVHTSGKNETKDRIKYSAQARYHVVKKFN